MRKVEDNNNITHNVEKRSFERNNIIRAYMNRVGGFHPQRPEMVIAYAHSHKTAIR